MPNQSKPFDATHLEPSVHRRMKLAAQWLGIPMREFLANAIELYIREMKIPEIVVMGGQASRLKRPEPSRSLPLLAQLEEEQPEL